MSGSAKRGQLRIYMGYAAGVGKTYAMLGEGVRRRERGTDVVIGVVETHGRPHTQERIADLEVMPRRRIDYRGATFEEMDLDTILVRAPEVVLVDELAHTNVPGSAHAKRWEDVEVLLDAGIDVISTLNIQHLESLNDVTERITGVRQRETIPDEVVRCADQQELVDMTPHALRRRMAHGNVYPPEKVDAALGNYFREGNLGALRELALLWMADRVDEALQDYMRDHGIEGPWETRERILVAVAGRPEDEALVRRAGRIAARRAGELHAVHVVAGDGLADQRAGDVATTRRLVESLGGAFHEVVGDGGIPEALLGFARAENVTQIVIGASTHPRWRELTRGSVVHRVIRASGPIDVHVISSEAPPGDRPLPRPRPTALPRSRRVAAIVVAAAGLVLMTPVLALLRPHLALSSVMLLYLSLVLAVAALGGLWPALGVAVVSSFVINFFFTPPIHTWTIAEAENVLALVVFVTVGTVVSVLVDRSARLRAEAQRGRAEVEALARLAGWISSQDDPLPGLVDHLRTTLGLASVAVVRRTDEGERVEAASEGPSGGEDDVGDRIELGGEAVLVLRGRPLTPEERRILAAFAAQVAVAVYERGLEREVAGKAELAEADELRTAILAAVSHDLRTPLASIKAAVSSLRQDDVVWSDEERAEFLATIEEETDRLTNLVGNLLDMSRLQTGALTLVHKRIGLDEIVPGALAGLPDHGGSIEVDVPETLPRVDVDAALLERAVANLVGNACAFSPPDQPVRVLGSSAGGRVELRIVDRGPGITPDDRERVFEPFQRLGDRSTVDGVGLGLAVSRGFVEAMGGSIEVDDTPGGGLTMVLSFPEAA